MYIVRDIFYLKFGHFRDARALLDDATKRKLLPLAKKARVLSDFTGDAYRLILEEGFETLTEYEKHLQSSMDEQAWKEWYEQFKTHVERSHREILKQIM
jgi:hypothetical protein